MIADFVKLSGMYLVVYVYVRQTWNRQAAMMVQWLAVVSLGLMILSVVMVPLKLLASDLHAVATTYTQGKEAVNKGIPGVWDLVKGKWSVPMKGEITQQFNGTTHHGIDISGSLGESIVSAGEGEVTKIAWSDDYGNFIIINHGKKVESLYAHLSKWNVKVGSPVTPGKQIGVCGSSGNSTGPHLHFEIRLNGKTVDPAQYFK